MSTAKLKFVDSPYFVDEDENWHLRDDAPEDVKREFEEYMQYSNECEEKGIYI